MIGEKRLEKRFLKSIFKGNTIPEQPGLCLCSFIWLPSERKETDPWNIRQKKEANSNKEAESFKGNKRNIQKLDTRNGKWR